MRKIVLLAVIFPFFFCNGWEHCVTPFFSIEEKIEFETHFLLTIPKHEIEKRCEAHIRRAECFLILRDFERALCDFEELFELSSFCKNSHKSFQFHCKSLFGMMLCFKHMGFFDRACEISDHLVHLLHHYPCRECREFIDKHSCF